MIFLLKVAGICFVLTVVSNVLLKVMFDSMDDKEKAVYVWNDIAPKRVLFFSICVWIFFLAMCISLIGAAIMV